MKHALLALVALAASVAASDALAACPQRVSVPYGATLSSIARACGIDVQSLMRVNPGLRADTLRAGSVIAVPRPALPSRQHRIGRPSVEIMPPLVPPSVGGPSAGVPSTVILPPTPPRVPPQHILPGFGPHPGQHPLPPGHIGTPPPPLQFN